MKLKLASLLLAGTIAASALPASAAIPIYPNPGTEVAGNPLFTSGSTGSVKAWFVGKGGASFNVSLGVIVNGVDRGLGINNQTFALGQLFNYGAINAGDSLAFYIKVADTGDTFSSNKTLNTDGIQHLYSLVGGYTGGDFGIPLTAARPGSYFGFEDLSGGGDFNYTDLQFVVRNGAIPEPASWALMIAGFGLVGGAARRRTKVHVTYA
jgi:Domain of unknown function (DUF4114)/PEP-CTERM motif